VNNRRRPDETGQIDHPGIPGGDNRSFRSQGQARNAALAAANALGPGYTIAHDPRPARGQPHYHVVAPTGRRVSGHFFYGRRAPRRVLRGRPWREFEGELARAARALAASQSAEQMSQPPPRSPWLQTAQTVGTEIAKQVIVPEGIPGELVDALIERLRFMYDLGGISLVPVTATLYSFISRGLPPLRALQATARIHQLRPRPRRVGPGSPGPITGRQVRARERRMLQRGLRPGRNQRFRR
jgi:hypothetical protein